MHLCEHIDSGKKTENSKGVAEENEPKGVWLVNWPIIQVGKTKHPEIRSVRNKEKGQVS